MGLEKNTHPLVLLGDPDPESVATLSALVESWHYSVEVERSGPDALAHLKEGFHPALALLENDLPQLFGIEVVQAWHRHPH